MFNRLTPYRYIELIRGLCIYNHFTWFIYNYLGGEDPEPRPERQNGGGWLFVNPPPTIASPHSS